MVKKKFWTVALCSGLVAVTALAGCGQAGTNGGSTEEKSGEASSVASHAETSQTAGAATSEEGAASGSDQEKADQVAKLIDAIYVQERTDQTDAQCEEAKKGWDALTDKQKSLVEGEHADPEYFGRDTGDASADNPLSQDGIGKKELLVVSFGTSFNNSRVADIGGIEKALQQAFPDWSVRRAFTAQIIINHIQARDQEKIDNMDQALERAVKNGVKELVVQPTHLMHGAEYDELLGAVDKYKDKFQSVKVAEPLLGEVGKSDTQVNPDKKRVCEAIVKAALSDGKYSSLKEAQKAGVAFVFMGHGTSHTANITYNQMQAQMKDLGYSNVFIGTVEGKPENTSCENVIQAVKKSGYKTVVLRPLMVVAGDHANNDMAGDDEDSWKSQFEAAGAFDQILTQIHGLGEIPEVQEIYIDHSAAATGEKAKASAEKESGSTEQASSQKALKDGTYLANFNTDSNMFHVNEAKEGKGTLTVKEGKMTIHIALPSKNIVNLFTGSAQEAAAKGAKLLQPVVEKVKYADGTEEEVNSFDLPVPELDKEFSVAIIGTKGKWYDHKVSVTNPVKK